jgi:hypothetical protein
VDSLSVLVYRNEESFKKRKLSNDEGNEYPLQPSISLDGHGHNENEEALIKGEPMKPSLFQVIMQLMYLLIPLK